MSKRPRSNVWDYFRKDEEYAHCLVGTCKAKVKHCGNTSNPLKHLESYHEDEHAKCVAERPTKKARPAQASTQLTLTESIASTRKYPRDSNKCKKLDDALVGMIVTDLQPISVVEDTGFLRYTSLLDPRYELPSRRTISRRLLPEKYEAVKKSLKQKLQKISPISLTTDIWSSRQAFSYCCLTAHVISEQWTLESYVLETFNFNTDHTAQHIGSELTRVINEWGSPTITCCVTDNATNMLAGIVEAGWNHLPCFAHTLNLVVQDSIKLDPTISELQAKCKAIVSHFHRSTKSSEKLRSVQEQLKMPQLKLIQDIVTRWNSTYLMLERIASQHEAITTTLCLLDKPQMCLSTDEKDVILQSLTLLQPFLQATEEISGEKYVSISMIIPLTRLLLRSCSAGPNSLLRQNLVQELNRRFSRVEQRYTMAVSTLLDPRFKKIGFADTSAVDQAVRRLQGEVRAMIDDEAQQTPSNADPQQSGSNDQQMVAGLWTTFDEKVAEATSHRSGGTDAFIEVKRYFEERNVDRKEDPLQWWKENGARFPHLMILAKKYLAIPGSSVPSERLFSKAGELISEKRSQLKPKNVDTILFLNKNLNSV